MKTIITNALSTNNSLSSIPIRIGLGVIMFAHGAQKLFGWFGGYGLEGTAGFFETNLGMSPGILFAALAGSVEFFGGILLAIGFATRPAALLVAITMFVAILKVHSQGFFAPNGMEYLLILILASVSLVINGGGALSLDQRLTPSKA